LQVARSSYPLLGIEAITPPKRTRSITRNAMTQELLDSIDLSEWFVS